MQSNEYNYCIKSVQFYEFDCFFFRTNSILGGVQVHLHLLSNSCKYFNRAVMMSGNAFNYWAYYKENNNVELLKEAFKDELGDQPSNEDVLNFLLSASAESIVAKAPAMDLFSQTTYKFFWTPVVEGLFTIYIQSICQLYFCCYFYCFSPKQTKVKLSVHFLHKNHTKSMQTIASANIVKT